MDKEGNPIKQQVDCIEEEMKDDDDMVGDSDTKNQDFITERYTISDLFSK